MVILIVENDPDRYAKKIAFANGYLKITICKSMSLGYLQMPKKEYLQTNVLKPFMNDHNMAFANAHKIVFEIHRVHQHPLFISSSTLFYEELVDSEIHRVHQHPLFISPSTLFYEELVDSQIHMVHQHLLFTSP